MGASIKGAGGAGGRRGRGLRHAPMAEINVTPFVDVMLVLLIIFMVAAPLLLSGVPVDLPTAKGQALNAEKDRLTVTVDRKGMIYVGGSEEPISLDQLVNKLKAIAKNGVDDQVLFRGDRVVEYGKVSAVLGAVRDGGFKKFTFVNGPEDIETGGATRQR